jgi:hypothetical protein
LAGVRQIVPNMGKMRKIGSHAAVTPNRSSMATLVLEATAVAVQTDARALFVAHLSVGCSAEVIPAWNVVAIVAWRELMA